MNKSASAPDHFLLFDVRGERLSDIAPTLAERFYLDNGPRYVFDENLSDAEKSETKWILRNSAGSSGFRTSIWATGSEEDISMREVLLRTFSL